MATLETTTTHRSSCPLDCPDACSLSVTVDAGRVVRIEGTHDNPLTQGFICSKVRGLDKHVYGAERIQRPAIRVGPKRADGSTEFRDATWEEALDLVAERMRALRDAGRSSGIVPISYGGSNGWLSEGIADRRFFGRLGASELARTLCAIPSGRAATGLYGKMIGADLNDAVHAKLIVVWGANPSASGIHLVPIIKKAREAGARLVVVDPRRTPLAKQADLHLAPRPGTDLPLALAVVRWLFETGNADEAFLAEHCREVDELKARAARWTVEEAARVCDVDEAAILELAGLYARSSPALVRCGWGLERNRNGGSAVAAVLALPAVAGKFGVRGGGYTMSNGTSWKNAVPDWTGEFAPGSRTINLSHLGNALADSDPPIELLYVYDCNPLATVPDQESVRRGLLRDDLFVAVHEQVWTDTALVADVVLPATTFLEHTDLNAGYGSTSLSLIEPVIEPVHEARPNLEVFDALSKRLELGRAGEPNTAGELFDAFRAKNPEVAERLANDGLAMPGEGPWPIPFVDHMPDTPDGKVHLVPDELDREAPDGLYTFRPDPGTAERPLALISPATSATVSSTFGQLVRQIVPLRMHPDDARARGLASGDEVRVENELGSVITTLEVTLDVRPGTVVLPKGLWRHNTRNGATANALCPQTAADLGEGACYNDARVEVVKA